MEAPGRLDGTWRVYSAVGRATVVGEEVRCRVTGDFPVRGELVAGEIRSNALERDPIIRMRMTQTSTATNNGTIMVSDFELINAALAVV